MMTKRTYDEMEIWDSVSMKVATSLELSSFVIALKVTTPFSCVFQ